jgi:regulator of protease activity HflC (stomatin/prohibitin superfamily)
MAQRKKLEFTAAAGLFVQVVFLVVCLMLGRASNSRAVMAETGYVAVGVFVWLIVLVHGYQRRKAAEEAEDRERLKSTRLSEEIFEEMELDTMRASSSLRVFEKYLVPVLTVLLSGVLGYLAWSRGKAVWGGSWEVENESFVAVGMVAITFFGYLTGRYAAGMAQNRGFRLLRAGAGFMIGNVLVALLITVAMALYYFGIEWGETVVAYVVPAVMGLVAVELLLNLILDIYRPRVAGQEPRPPYDSRLLGLFAEPEGVLKTVASTLDYQFGFKVSDTWFYHFLERAIVPLVFVQVLSLWLMTSLVVVEEREVAFIERFGRPVLTEEDAAAGLRATLFGPGFHFKLPWPLGVTQRVPAYEIHRIEVGKVYEPTQTAPTRQPFMEDPDFILWRESHIRPEEGFEATFLVPSMAAEDEQAARTVPVGLTVDQTEPAAELTAPDAPGAVETSGAGPQVNLVRLEANIYYRIKTLPDGTVDPDAAFTYHYRQDDIGDLLTKLGFRATAKVAASQDFLKWVAEERALTAREIWDLMAEAVAEADLGIEIVDVNVLSVHPPSQVASAFELVVTALEDRESLIHLGQQESTRILRGAEAHETELVKRASGRKYMRETVSAAEAGQFRSQLAAYAKAPDVFVYRTYFDTLEEALKDQRVFIVPVSENEVQIIDLEEKIRAEILSGLDALEGE